MSAVRLSDVKDGTIKTGVGEIMDATNEASRRLDVSIKAKQISSIDFKTVN